MQFLVTLGHDVFKALSDDLGAGFHDLHVAVLDGVKVELDDGLLVEQALDAEVAEVLEEALAAHGVGLCVERVEVLFVNFVPHNADLLQIKRAVKISGLLEKIYLPGYHRCT